MTLQEMKEKVYRMIEEYDENADELTNDPDFSAKINSVINQIQNELSRYKKIPAYTTREVEKGQIINLKDIDNQIYQLNAIKEVEYTTLGKDIRFEEDGEATITYFKYPKQITPETDDSYKFELSDDILEIMPYGVAGDLLKSDVSNNYGQIYANRYRELLQQLDPRYDLGQIRFEGGIDV